MEERLHTQRSFSGDISADRAARGKGAGYHLEEDMAKWDAGAAAYAGYMVSPAGIRSSKTGMRQL